jgi:phosphoribosyl 1,2-cyclic phosphodiesterase
MLVEAGDTRVLVDVGFGVRTLTKRLAAVGCAPESITGVVLTHEHVDHAQGALAACARWQWPLYATAGTLANLPTPIVPVRTIAHGQPWSIGDLHGSSTAVPHDAADCAALVFEHAASGERIGIALDLGHVPDSLGTLFHALDLLVIEANHDTQQLISGPYPWPLKQRIMGGRGHLANDAAAVFVAACAHRGLRAVVLAHLSETNNSPALAVDAVRTALRRRSGRTVLARDGIHAATQRIALGPVSCRDRRSTPIGQLELAL